MSIRNKVRAAAAGALTLALLVGGGASAFAAPGDPINPQPNGSKGSFFLWDANTFELSDKDTSRVYTRDELLVGSASSTDFMVEINPAATRPVTGETEFTQVWRFISDKTSAAVSGGTNTWKATGVDSAAGPNGGTLLPDMTLDAFDGVDALISSGGSYYYGVAYTINNGVTVIGAVYREINITAGSGNYTVGAVEVEATEAEDVATTTSLSADRTEAEAGSKVALTATVAATGHTVTGNVEFYRGSTKVATVGSASGSVTYDATVNSVGENKFSAKFVGNTVGEYRFLASASNEVTVTGTQPSVELPPNAPSENALNENTANDATAEIDADQVTLTVDPSLDGEEVYMFAYSTPTYLGKATVADGKVTVDVSSLPAGDHKLAIVDPDTGDVLAWAEFTKTTDAAIDLEFSKQINAHVASAAEPADGEFSLVNLGGDTVTLDNPTLVNGESVSSGELGAFKVTDLRLASKPGWDLKTTVDEFTLQGGTDTIANSALGIAPENISQAGTGALAPTLGAAQVSGSASYPWDFATLAADNYSGVSTLNAGLQFTAPAGSTAGIYESNLTLTLVSK